MSDKKKTAAVISVFLVSLCLLFFSIHHLKNVQKNNETALYQIDSAVSGETAKQILSDIKSESNHNQAEYDLEKENVAENTADNTQLTDEHKIVFWKQEDDGTIQNTEYERTAAADIIKLYGDSVLFFPYSYPLNVEDEMGCLLGEPIAWELFGSANPVGARITYKKKIYEIRGIIPKENLLVIEGGDQEVYSHLAVAEADLYARNNLISRLQNLYGIMCAELPLRFYEREAKCYVVMAAMLLYGLAVFFVCRRCSKFKGIKIIKKFALLGGILGIFTGFFYILSLSAYTLPDQVSDLSWWSSYFKSEWTEYRNTAASLF